MILNRPTALTLVWVACAVMTQQVWLTLADAFLALAAAAHRRGHTGDRFVHAAARCYRRADCPQAARAVRVAFRGAR